MNAVHAQERRLPRLPGGVPSAHADRSLYGMLPHREDWPVFDYSAEHLARFPDYLNAAQALLDSAVSDGFGAKPVFHFEEESWTYGQLQDRVDRIARVLVEDYGLVPGNRVLLRSGNCPMLAACWLAVLKAGGICITTMPMLRAQELVFILDRVRVRFALCEESLAEELAIAGRSAGTLEKIACFTPLGATGPRAAELDRALHAKPAGFAPVRTAADDIAVVTFTSGTSGRPKAAAHFHRDLLAIAECYPRVYTVAADEVVGGSPSLAFTYGLAVMLIYPLRHRASVAYVHRPTPEQVLGAVERYRVTSLYGVPTSYHQLLDALDRFDVTSLRKCASSGDFLQMPLWDAWLERTGIRLVNGFGASEMTCTFLSESMAVDRIGSTGRAVPGYTARLIDNDGQLLPPGSSGRLAVRGPTGCRYLDDPEQQKKFVEGGWNLTSDLFVEDRDGWFWYVDRTDDMIVSSGYNISPREVEQALAAHPMVRECAVVGVDDAARGKLVRACVVLHDPTRATQETGASLQEFVKQRIAPYKYPRDVRFYGELPKTHTGKIQRQRLRVQ